jgi:5-methylthioribose kinase
MSSRQHQLLQLNVENIPAYFKAVKYRLPFSVDEINRIEEVGEYSNNNYLFRITIKNKKHKNIYYLKQAQTYNRRSVVQGKPFWVSPGRMGGEIKLLGRLQKLWGDGVVPGIYFYDQRHHIFLMSDVAGKGKILIEEFARNKVHPEIGATLGGYLGRLHATTYKNKESSGASNDWCKVMVGFFDTHWGHGVRQHFPHHEVQSFYEEVCSAPTSIVWGDAVHRNVFVKTGRRVGLIDFDHTVRYDPMVDVGMLLAHWTWMWLKGRAKISRESEKFIRSFSTAYWKPWVKQSKLTNRERSDMRHRLPRWIGLYLVSRVDGKTGSYFEEWPAWERRIRKLGIELFGERQTSSTKSYLRLLSI